MKITVDVSVDATESMAFIPARPVVATTRFEVTAKGELSVLEAARLATEVEDAARCCVGEWLKRPKPPEEKTAE